MASNLISPLLWMSLPFKSETAFLDWGGQHQTWHYALARATKTAFILLDDLRDNMESHASLHNQIADALGVSRVGDMTSFSLEDETSWISFHYLNAADHERFRVAAGI